MKRGLGKVGWVYCRVIVIVTNEKAIQPLTDLTNWRPPEFRRHQEYIPAFNLTNKYLCPSACFSKCFHEGVWIDSDR